MLDLSPLWSLDQSGRLSAAQIFAKLPPKFQAQLRTLLTELARAGLEQSWEWWARPQQMAPPGDWVTWVIMSGRGFGKTRAGSEWVIQKARDFPGCRIALIAAKPEDYRNFMIEGPAGIVTVSPPDFQAHYHASLAKITWPNGSEAHCFSDKSPDSLRGPNNDFAWVDEFGKFRYQKEVWENLRFTMRSGEHPQTIITTTPVPPSNSRKS